MTLTNEVEAMGDMFTRMNRRCYDKCLANAVAEGRDYGEELSIDEDKCLVSCASKFVATQQKVGEIFMQEAQAAGN